MRLTTLRLTLILFVVLFALSLAGCRKGRSEFKDSGAASGVGHTSGRGAIVVAKVGDEEITQQDLEAALERVPVWKRESVKDKVLDGLIEAKVFAGEAKKAGLENDPDVQKKLEKKTDETLARYFVKKYLDKEAEPPEEELRQYYEKHKDRFVVSDRARIQHILVRDKKKAEGLLEKLKAGGSFEALAKKNSVCRCWKKGGHHGWVYKGKVEPELENVVFGSKKGELTGIIETKKGHEILKVLDRQVQREIPFEEARPRIRYSFFVGNKRQLVDKYYEAAGVNKHPDEPGVLLKIGDEAIPEDLIAPILARASEKEREKVRKRQIDHLAQVRVFSNEGRKVRIQDDPDVSRELARSKERLLAGAFRKKFLSGQGKVTDEVVAEYYRANPEKFRIPERVKVKSILVKTKEEAEAVLKEVNKGTAFGSLAIKKSLHPLASRRAGGLGWFSKEEKDPALEKAAFSLEKGQVSDIIKTAAGYEVIKLMDKKAASIRPLDEVKDRIKMHLTRQQRHEVKQRYYKKAGVKILAAKAAPAGGQ